MDLVQMFSLTVGIIQTIIIFTQKRMMISDCTEQWVTLVAPAMHIFSAKNKKN